MRLTKKQKQDVYSVVNPTINLLPGKEIKVHVVESLGDEIGYILNIHKVQFIGVTTKPRGDGWRAEDFNSLSKAAKFVNGVASGKIR